MDLSGGTRPNPTTPTPPPWERDFTRWTGARWAQLIKLSWVRQ